MTGPTGLEWQTVQIPLAGGLDLKPHPYAIKPPGLTTAKNVEFDEAGALRVRKPYTSLGTSVYPSGTLSNVRKLAVVGDELLCFTADTLYSWSETLSAWVSKGTHLAVKVEETTRFSNPTDQVFADRAQLGGVVVMAWTELLATAATVYVAAFDATTGATLIEPVSLGSGNSRPRVIATDSKIFVLWTSSGVGLVCKTIDPTAPAFAVAGATTVSAFGGPYDVAYNPTISSGVVGAVGMVGGGSYEAFKVSTALAVTTAPKILPVNQIAVASISNKIQVFRTDPTPFPQEIRADLLDDTFANVIVNTLIGTHSNGVSQITAAYSTVPVGGLYRCHVFWADGAGSNPNAGVYGADVFARWIDTAGTRSVGNTFAIYNQMLASHAFDHNGSVYVSTVFGGANGAEAIGHLSPATLLGFSAQLQNSYFLYRDDGHLVSKATWGRAGGTPHYTNHLPGVALTSGTTVYSWAGTERGIVPLPGDGQTAYAARAPRDIAYTFDSDEARRTAQLGQTLYVSGGMLLQYDGEALTEVGFNQYPWGINCSATVFIGTMVAGDYSYKGTLRWDNARGETERSTTAVGVSITALANDIINVGFDDVINTRKKAPLREPALEVWRTQINPSVESPFYMVTSRDPATTGNNAYSLSGGGVNDTLADAALELREQSQDEYGLPRLAPPGASILLASDSRLFLAGIPGEPHRIWYSRYRADGEIASFHDALSLSLPATTGPITALALMGGSLIAFTASAIYAIPGDGYDNTGGGSNYGSPRLISSDVGALSHNTLVLAPVGLIFFSRKGWYRLGLGLDLEYIGAPVEDFNTLTWVAAQVVAAQHQVRVLASTKLLVWDYLVNQWAEWGVTGGGAVATNRDLAMWRTSPMWMSSVVTKQSTSHASADYNYEVETGWIPLAGVEGCSRVRWIEILGEYKATHTLRVQVGFNYATTYADDRSISIATTPAQVRHGPSKQRVQAIRIRLTGPAAGQDPIALAGIGLEVGLKRGLYRQLPAAQKQ